MLLFVPPDLPEVRDREERRCVMFFPGPVATDRSKNLRFFSCLSPSGFGKKKLFLARRKICKKGRNTGVNTDMEDALITEHAGTRRDEITRYYQYGSGGVRVLDAKKTVKRVYLFDPSSSIMTERDPRHQDKILRRFIFDRYGMLEETFAFGERPRTFKYENGARQIAIREGGDYGAVGKIITFEENGISETAWGRNGEIERVYQFDPKGDAITVRAGGWFGDVKRTIVFGGMGASLFHEPESFLQFLMFTEWSEKDTNDHVSERVAEIRGSGSAGAGGSPYAYNGPRGTASGVRSAGQGAPAPANAAQRRSGAPRPSRDDSSIDFIPDADTPSVNDSRGQRIMSRQSRDISFQERRGSDGSGEKMSAGRSAEIPLEERFAGSNREREPLSRGRSAEIPLEERFENAQRERGKLPRGRSADIPYDERRGGGD